MPSFNVVDRLGRTVLATDDWVEAEWACHEALMASRSMDGHDLLHIRGTHPTHAWARVPNDTPRCSKCGAWDNTSYGSHAPCGYDFEGQALVTVLKRERAALTLTETGNG